MSLDEVLAHEPLVLGVALGVVLESGGEQAAQVRVVLVEQLAQLGRKGPVFRQAWPAFDETLAKEDAAEVVLQVNGKVRGRIAVPFGASQETLEKAALADPKTQPFLAGKQVVKMIVVPDKLVNIVVR